MIRPALTVALAATAAGACDSGDDDALVVADGLAVAEAWARPTPAGAGEAAVYVTLELRDGPNDRLIGSTSQRCTVMLPHVTTVEDDIASMSEADADQLALVPGDTLEMTPGGLHLMCLGLADPLVAGERFDVELRFGAHDPVAVPVTVEQR